MSLSDRFIRNPVLTTVCSLVILLIGSPRALPRGC